MRTIYVVTRFDTGHDAFGEAVKAFSRKEDAEALVEKTFQHAKERENYPNFYDWQEAAPVKGWKYEFDFYIIQEIPMEE